MNVRYGDPKLWVKMLQVKKVSERALRHTDEKSIIEFFINIKFNKSWYVFEIWDRIDNF